MFTADEQDVMNYMKSFPGLYVSGKEVCRRAGGKRRFRENQRWAIPILISLHVRGFVEVDEFGHFRLLKKRRLTPANGVLMTENSAIPTARFESGSGGPKGTGEGEVVYEADESILEAPKLTGDTTIEPVPETGS
jgi:hypothetical protein